MKYYSQDITFCSNKKCTRKTCERHYSHIRWDIKPYQSIADFENTEYCPKKKKAENRDEIIERQEKEILSLKNRIELLEIEKKMLEEAKDRSTESAVEVIGKQDEEIKILTEQRDKAVKDFEGFARIAFENPFACQHCAHSVENGRACLWKLEHEDEEEACLGRHFEYRGMEGVN